MAVGITYLREPLNQIICGMLAFALCVLAALLLLFSSQARAVPAFARQTHQPCVACHVGGRQFKLLGYTLKVGDDTKVPLSAMLIESFTQTQKNQVTPLANGFGTNDNTELQQASLFFAGPLADHLGALAQATYSQNGGLLGWDNTDVRYARTLTTGSHTTIWGVSLNNNPSLDDIFNTTPAWQFPYTAPDLAPSAPAAPILMGGLAQQVVGINGYAQIDSALYVEAGVYRSLSPSFLRTVNAEFDGRLSGITPYARVAYTWNLPNGNLELGGFALNAQRGLAGVNAAGNAVAISGPTDKFHDVGIDASYQFLNGGNHIFTINATYLGEHQRLDATYVAGDSSNLDNTLHSLNINGSYWYKNTWGATLGAFTNDGSRDLTLYGNNGSPNTNGGVVELNWNPFGQASSWADPFVNVRFGLQYTFYTRFSGLVYDVDGAGRTAADNNTLYLYTWLAF
jgi:hypothetical protein